MYTWMLLVVFVLVMLMLVFLLIPLLMLFFSCDRGIVDVDVVFAFDVVVWCRRWR